MERGARPSNQRDGKPVERTYSTREVRGALRDMATRNKPYFRQGGAISEKRTKPTSR